MINIILWVIVIGQFLINTLWVIVIRQLLINIPWVIVIGQLQCHPAFLHKSRDLSISIPWREVISTKSQATLQMDCARICIQLLVHLECLEVPS